MEFQVTEREYNIARASDRGKILVYVKALPNDDREAKESEFMDRVTGFQIWLFQVVGIYFSGDAED